MNAFYAAYVCVHVCEMCVWRLIRQSTEWMLITLRAYFVSPCLFFLILRACIKGVCCICMRPIGNYYSIVERWCMQTIEFYSTTNRNNKNIEPFVYNILMMWSILMSTPENVKLYAYIGIVLTPNMWYDNDDMKQLLSVWHHKWVHKQLMYTWKYQAVDVSSNCKSKSNTNNILF